jgi:hypothetical protein
MIVRTPKRARYTIISNVALEDKRLSWKARGLAAYLLSKPDNWEVRTYELVSASDADGRRAVLTGLQELEKCGYLVREQNRLKGGQWDAGRTFIYEEPQVASQVENRTTAPQSPNGPSVSTCGNTTNPQAAPQVPKPPADNGTVVNTDLANTEEVNTDLSPSPSRTKAKEGSHIDKLRNLPCEWSLFVRLLNQMSLECFGKGCDLVTDANFKELREATGEVVRSMQRYKLPIHSKYIHGFAYYYGREMLGGERFEHPRPLCYPKYWDNIDDGSGESWWETRSVCDAMVIYCEAVKRAPKVPYTASWIFKAA